MFQPQETSWASRAVGEIARITQISGQSVWLDRNLHHSYRQELNPKAKPIKMVKNVGFENFKIERIDSDSSYNIFMKYAIIHGSAIFIVFML